MFQGGGVFLVGNLISISTSCVPTKCWDSTRNILFEELSVVQIVVGCLIEIGPHFRSTSA
jgi:hypothetical protein